MIVTEPSAFAVKVDQPFRVAFEAKLPSNADAKYVPTCVISGRVGATYRQAKGGRLDRDQTVADARLIVITVAK